MNDLVYVQKEVPFTDSMIIAKATNNQHKSVVKLIKQHARSLEKFGKIEFSDFKSPNSGRGRPTTIYQLNEMQATLLVTFFDNTPIVVDFKTELVRQFFEMKMVLEEKRTQTWVDSRINSKLVRKREADAIKEFIEYAKEQGSKHADKYYIHFSKLANRFANIGDRDYSSVAQLSQLSMAENIILNIVEAGILQNKTYKDIYKDCKERLDLVSELAFVDNLNEKLQSNAQSPISDKENLEKCNKVV